MKILFAHIACCIILCSFGACSKSDFAFQNDYEQSFQLWQRFKDDHNDSYRYTVTGSSWAGRRWETTLTIQGGKVTKREFHYQQYNGLEMPPGGWTIVEAEQIADEHTISGMPVYFSAADILPLLSWIEVGDEVGLQTYGAAAPRTLDEIYHLAANEWLVSRPDATTSFEAHNNGLISNAGFVPHNCVDDCFTGIVISSILPL